MFIRKSKESDRKIIKELFEKCFRSTSDGDDSCLDDLDSRYYLLFEDDKLIAMSGISFSRVYNAVEIDYTCVHPDYRHKGYMNELFKIMLKPISVLEDVYCSCWQAAGEEKVHLHNVMNKYGFKEVIHNRIHWKPPYNCKYTDSCTYSKGDSCECYEHLYLKKPTKNNLSITYSNQHIFIYQIEEVIKLFKSVGWVDESAAYPDRLIPAIENSDYVVSAWDGEKLVGLLTALDDTMHAYVQYLLVHPNYQNLRIGEELFGRFNTYYFNYKKELKTENAQHYYEKFGYKVESVGMVKNDLQ